MANYVTTDTDLTLVANSIRRKANIGVQLVYPYGFVNAIDTISTTSSELPFGLYFDEEGDLCQREDYEGD